MFRRPRDEYISTISKPTSWGGAIELAILAKHYSTQIASIDVETGRIDKFSPPAGSDSGNRCILIYSGIHYDAATIAPILEAPDDFHQTLEQELDHEADIPPSLMKADLVNHKVLRFAIILQSWREGEISVAAKISRCRSDTLNWLKSTWIVVTPFGCLSRTGAIRRFKCGFR